VLIKLGADVEVDIATGDEMAEHVRKGIKGSSAKGRAFPLVGSNANLEATVSGSPGDGVIRLGRPPNGQVWNIVSVMVLGIDDHTSGAAKCALYTDSDPANLNLSSCEIPGITVPYFNAISKQTIWAHSSGQVCLNVTGSGGAQVVAKVGVVEYRWDEIFDSGLR
jgi:hypothetical protein